MHPSLPSGGTLTVYLHLPHLTRSALACRAAHESNLTSCVATSPGSLVSASRTDTVPVLPASTLPLPAPNAVAVRRRAACEAEMCGNGTRLVIFATDAGTGGRS
jgi:uncharacterized protein GlcG (DUF336 family)